MHHSLHPDQGIREFRELATRRLDLRKAVFQPVRAWVSALDALEVALAGNDAETIRTALDAFLTADDTMAGTIHHGGY